MSEIYSIYIQYYYVLVVLSPLLIVFFLLYILAKIVNA